MSRKIGYARVSTDDLHGKAQLAALAAVPCDAVFFEQESGAERARPELAKALASLRPGDTLIVARLERLGRSLIHLLQIIEALEGRGVAFRSLAEGFDLTTAEGRLMMQQLGAFAEFERQRITARIQSGIAAAKRRGVRFGNPQLLAGDPAMTRAIVRARDETFVNGLIDRMETFMPVVRRLRPHTPWPMVAAAVSQATATHWSAPRLRRSVRRLVAEGLADAGLLAKAAAKPRRRSAELATLARGIALANPGRSLRQIAAQLQAMNIPTPAGKTTWRASSVAHLLARAGGSARRG